MVQPALSRLSSRFGAKSSRERKPKWFPGLLHTVTTYKQTSHITHITYICLLPAASVTNSSVQRILSIVSETQQIHARQFCLTLSVINNLKEEWFTYILDMSALSNTYISFKCCYFLFSALQLQLVFTQFFLCVACNNSFILFYFIYQVMDYFNCSWHLLQCRHMTIN